MRNGGSLSSFWRHGTRTCSPHYCGRSKVSTPARFGDAVLPGRVDGADDTTPPLQVSSALVLAVRCCHTGGMTSPIIVTAALPPEIFSYANGLRTEHFPPERNYLSAHLTLFHALPPSVEPELRGLMADLAGESPPPPARINRIVSLGRGTALGIESDALIALRDRIADRFAGCLTPQDNHRPRLHVTVQNKVSPDEARRLQAQLSSGFTPREFTIPALEAHYYRGGPWEEAGRWPLRGRPAQRR